MCVRVFPTSRITTPFSKHSKYVCETRARKRDEITNIVGFSWFWRGIWRVKRPHKKSIYNWKALDYCVFSLICESTLILSVFPLFLTCTRIWFRKIETYDFDIIQVTGHSVKISLDWHESHRLTLFTFNLTNAKCWNSKSSRQLSK